MSPIERLAKVHRRLLGAPDSASQQTMQSVWANLFEVHDQEDDVTPFLLGLRDEIGLVRNTLLERNVPDELVQQGLEPLKTIASLGLLSTNYGSIRGYIAPNEVRTSLLWACWALQDEFEEDFDSAEREALMAEIDGIEERLEACDLPPFSKHFIKRQLDAIRRALKMYSVRGIRPLSTAMEGVMGAFHLDGKRVVDETKNAGSEAKGILERTTGVIKKSAEVCDHLDKIRKFGEGAASIAASVGPYLLEVGKNIMK